MDDSVQPAQPMRHPFGIHRYGLALLSVFLTVAAQIALSPGRSLTVPLLVSLLAVILTAYFGGRGAALFATAANLVVNCYFFAEPRFRMAVADTGDRWRLAAFVAAGVGVSFLSHRFSHARLFPRVTLIAASSVLLVIVASLVWLDFENSREAEGWVEHTYQVLNAAETLLATMQNAEGQQRDYLLTGQEQYIQPYREAVAAERVALEKLRALTTDNPSQQRQLADANRLAEARFTRLERGIDIRREKGLDAALVLVGPGAGARLMDDFGATLEAVEAEEHRLLTSRANTAAEQTAHTRAALAGGTAVLVALLILAGLIIESDLAKLQASAKKLRRQAELLERAHEPIFTWTLGGPIDYWNRGAQELYGLSSAQAVGRRSHDLLHTRHPLGMPAIEESLLREGRWRGELTHEVGGREIVVESLMTLVAETGGRKAVLEADRDVTEEKRAQEEIGRLNQELEQRVNERTAQLETSNKELEAFAYSVSHDLRAPLRGIDGWSLALSEDYGLLLDETARQYLHRVRAETQRMGRLIDDLLKLSRLTRVALQHESIDFSSMARAIACRLREAEPGRTLEFIVQDGLSVSGDSHLLEVALTNLLSNSVKFTGPREVACIEFGQMQCGQESPFYVRDNGVGFDMAYADMLFGAFQRMHRHSEFPGSGVGLATAHRVLRRHGGRIWADAKVNEGATFYFTIPADASR
jgi:PAS domain S-box-containing protein